MYNVIFLDIDGVLNSELWNDNHQKEISDGILIDEEKVKLLSKLIRSTSAKIILHSSWRFWFDADMKPLKTEAKRLADFLESEGLKIEGMTPYLTKEEIRASKKFSYVKADEILLWISTHEDIKNWVVIDDLDLHNSEVEKHQIKTDPAIGLTAENVQEAEKILLDERHVQ